MTVRKEPSGRFRAVLKSGREYVAGRTFDTKREAQAWLAREKAGLAGGVDPRAGRPTVRSLLPVWLEERQHTVAAKTYVTDKALKRLVPTSLGALSIGAVTSREGFARAGEPGQERLGRVVGVSRFRESLSAFFAWAVRERMILVNPVTGTKVPRSSEPRVEMYPFGEADLERVYENARMRSVRLAEILLIDAWTGLRWSELRALRVRDFVEVPLPVLVVQVAEPEGVAVKVTKSRKSRRVPVADRVLPMVRRMATNREPDAPLLRPTPGTSCTRRRSSGRSTGR